MEQGDTPRDPFSDFINQALNMDQIEGLNQEAIIARVSQIVEEFPTTVTPDLWNDQLDDLQAIIRVGLDLNTMLRAFENRLDPSEFTRDDLEALVMLSVTFSFVCYNRLRPTYNFDEQYTVDNDLLARRLRDTLQAAMGWVKTASRNGDVVARKFLQETEGLLDASQHLD